MQSQWDKEENLTKERVNPERKARCLNDIGLSVGLKDNRRSSNSTAKVEETVVNQPMYGE